MLLKEIKRRENLDKHTNQKNNDICKKHLQKLLETNHHLEVTFDKILNS